MLYIPTDYLLYFLADFVQILLLLLLSTSISISQFVPSSLFFYVKSWIWPIFFFFLLSSHTHTVHTFFNFVLFCKSNKRVFNRQDFYFCFSPKTPNIYLTSLATTRNVSKFSFLKKKKKKKHLIAANSWMMAFIFNPKYVCKCNDKYRFSVCTYIYI